MNCREHPIDLEEIKPPLCPYPLGSPKRTRLQE